MADDHDEEMMELFRAESAEQLDELEQALGRLETDPADAEAIEAARRQAHNLKGAARIMGMEGIERLAHNLEDTLHEAERLGAEQTTTLHEGLESLRELVEAASRGEEAQVPVGDVVERLQEGSGEPGAPAEATGEDDGGAEAGGQEGKDPLQRAREQRIETVRVDPHRLDALMRRANELSTSVQRLHKVCSQLEGLKETLDELSRTVREELPAQTETAVSQVLRRRAERAGDDLTDAIDQLETDRAELARLADAIEGGVQEARLLPVETTFSLFARAACDLADEQGKEVEVELEGEQVRADKRVLEEMRGPLMHLVRNAVDHGLEPPEERREAGKDPVGLLRMAARRTPDSVVVEVEDDGRGIDPDEIRRLARRLELLPEAQLERLGDGEVLDLVFRSGFTTRETVSEVSGRGVGLQAVAESADELQGTVDLDSTPGEGTRVAIEVPIEVSTARVLLARCGPHSFGIPVDAISRVLKVDADDVEQEDGQATIEAGGARVPLADIGEALAIRSPPRDPFAEGRRPCVLLRESGQEAGLLVDELVGETELVVEPLGGVLRSVRTVTGAGVLADGQVCVILDPGEVAARIREAGPLIRGERLDAGEAPRVLVVEDAPVTRRQLQRLLEHAGWEVVTAEDGRRGIEALDETTVDAVVTDILMPEVDGIELTRRIREDPRLHRLPVVLLSTQSDDPAEAVEETGADAFISKEVFEPDELEHTLEELVA